MAKPTAIMPDGSINFLNKAALMQALGVDQAALNKKSLELAHLARAKWIQVAKQRLNRSEREYSNSIQTVESDGNGGASVTLTGTFPNIIENGNERPRDMREWLFSTRTGGTILQGKRGPYRIIPFRVSFAGTGRDIPLAGVAYKDTIGKEAADALRRRVKQELDQMRPSVQITLKNGRMRTKISSGRIMDADGGPKFKSTHTTGLFSGIQHFTDQKGKNGQYKMFRVISQNVGKDKTWMYPITKGRHLVDDVQEYVNRMAGEVIAQLTHTKG